MANLRLVTDFTRNVPGTATIQEWADSISTLTGGAHSVTVYYAGELVSTFDTLDAVATGVADMAWLTPSFYTGAQPTWEVFSLPFMAETGPDASQALFDVLSQGLFDPYGLTTLAAGYSDPAVLLLSEIAAASPTDLQGAKIVNRAGNIGADLLDDAGANAFPVAAAEIFIALQVGIADGVLISAALADRLGLEEITDTQLVFPGAQGLFTHTQALVIDQDVLSGLPADLRTVLQTSTGVGLSREIGAASLARYQDALAAFAAAGDGLVEASGADLAAWQALADQVNAEVLDRLGPEAQALANALAEAMQADLPGITIGDDFGSDAPFALILPVNLGVSSATELDGATVALITGTLQELAVFEYFEANNMSYEPVPVDNAGEAITQFLAGAADVLVVPTSWITPAELPPEYEVMPEQLGDAAVLMPTEGADDLLGTEGPDDIAALGGDDRVAGLGGDDSLYGNTGNDTLLGGEGDDRLDGGNGDDSLAGADGADTLLGGKGYDTLRGGDGNDRVVGGDGRDLAYLGGGDDLFFDNAQGGVNGRDTVWANAGNDTVQGGNGDDVFYGEGGADLILGRLGNDRLFGGDQNDTLRGGDGNDVVAGGNGRDRAFLGAGNDQWFDNDQVQFGDDFIDGWTGDDTIRMGGGNDTAVGGDGADVFVFAAGIDADVIRDYQLGQDALQIDTGLWGGDLDLARLEALTDTSSGTLVLDFGGGHSITFEGLTTNAGLLDDIVLV
ncbi:TRAP transporter substrate-binding protein DctP [Thetidibacter halocola]|uniref:TRAP transporter substrate-binding protein DctP n=1 Tax=Thetidibacter halocola TaxID=2827239 RepID=A0A8J7WFM7_9RHOB|nr:TRAP transporter substrate-binding protein DctP [Thetidibacter halocola]MBS0126802.1 TRAP transporter substrate-binding protein DctP [Thetidibacter halocola]